MIERFTRRLHFRAEPEPLLPGKEESFTRKSGGARRLPFARLRCGNDNVRHNKFACPTRSGSWRMRQPLFWRPFMRAVLRSAALALVLLMPAVVTAEAASAPAATTQPAAVVNKPAVVKSESGRRAFTRHSTHHRRRHVASRHRVHRSSALRHARTRRAVAKPIAVKPIGS